MPALSANLSSSNNVEQIMLFHDDKLFQRVKRSGIRSPAHGIWSSERSKAWHGVG